MLIRSFLWKYLRIVGRRWLTVGVSLQGTNYVTQLLKLAAPAFLTTIIWHLAVHCALSNRPNNNNLKPFKLNNPSSTPHHHVVHRVHITWSFFLATSRKSWLSFGALTVLFHLADKVQHWTPALFGLSLDRIIFFKRCIRQTLRTTGGSTDPTKLLFKHIRK